MPIKVTLLNSIASGRNHRLGSSVLDNGDQRLKIGGLIVDDGASGNAGDQQSELA